MAAETFLRLPERKTVLCHLFYARPHGEMTRRSVTRCYWMSRTLFQVQFSLMYSLQLARIKMVLKEKLDCWNTGVAECLFALLYYHSLRERPAAWIFKNVCLNAIKIHTNWYCSSEVAYLFGRCTVTFTKYSLPFSATKRDWFKEEIVCICL